MRMRTQGCQKMVTEPAKQPTFTPVYFITCFYVE